MYQGHYIEYDRIITFQSLESVQKRVEEIKKTDPTFSRWKYERGANHVHADMSALDREHVRQELEIAADFKEDLEQTYPTRSFVITHIPCYAVSFYQAVEGAPTEDIPPQGPRKDRVWCQHCQHTRPYEPLPHPDPVFPKVEWGTCNVCGNDLVVYAGELLTLVRACQ